MSVRDGSKQGRRAAPKSGKISASPPFRKFALSSLQSPRQHQRLHPHQTRSAAEVLLFLLLLSCSSSLLSSFYPHLLSSPPPPSPSPSLDHPRSTARHISKGPSQPFECPSASFDHGSSYSTNPQDTPYAASNRNPSRYPHTDDEEQSLDVVVDIPAALPPTSTPRISWSLRNCLAVQQRASGYPPPSSFELTVWSLVQVTNWSYRFDFPAAERLSIQSIDCTKTAPEQFYNYSVDISLWRPHHHWLPCSPLPSCTGGVVTTCILPILTHIWQLLALGPVRSTSEISA